MKWGLFYNKNLIITRTRMTKTLILPMAMMETTKIMTMVVATTTAMSMNTIMMKVKTVLMPRTTTTEIILS